MKEFEIEIILDKEEISTEFKIVCWKESYKGQKLGAIKRAKELKREWNAELYNIYEIKDKKVLLSLWKRGTNKMYDLEIDVVTGVDELEIELMEKEIRILDDVTLETDYDVIDLLPCEEWKTVRWYLRNIMNYHSLQSLVSNLDEIVNDIKYLELVDDQKLKEFVSRIKAVVKYYKLDNKQ